MMRGYCFYYDKKGSVMTYQERQDIKQYRRSVITKIIKMCPGIGKKQLMLLLYIAQSQGMKLGYEFDLR